MTDLVLSVGGRRVGGWPKDRPLHDITVGVTDRLAIDLAVAV